MGDLQLKDKDFRSTYSFYLRHWQIDTKYLFLNHGSFGACPTKILEKQNQFRIQMEQEPLKFFTRDLMEYHYISKKKLSEFINAENENLVFIKNATTGVNAILSSLRFNQGAEIIITNHIYPACRNAVNYFASKNHWVVREVGIPFPIEDEDIIIELILKEVSQKTKLLLIDHISSATGLVFPVQQIADEFNHRNIDVLVDGAHAPGSVQLDLKKLRPSFYTGNCHKWICSPKGSAFLYVRPDKQADIFPLIISLTAHPNSSFEERFFWQGTEDPSPYLCVGESIHYMNSICQGGWAEIMQRNHGLAVEGRKLICDRLGIEIPCPENMLASLASIPVPDTKDPCSTRFGSIDSLQEKLFQNYNIELFVTYWPAYPKRLIRISPQLYNSITQYSILAEVLFQEI